MLLLIKSLMKVGEKFINQIDLRILEIIQIRIKGNHKEPKDKTLLIQGAKVNIDKQWLDLKLKR